MWFAVELVYHFRQNYRTKKVKVKEEKGYYAGQIRLSGIMAAFAGQKRCKFYLFSGEKGCFFSSLVDFQDKKDAATTTLLLVKSFPGQKRCGR